MNSETKSEPTKFQITTKNKEWILAKFVKTKCKERELFKRCVLGTGDSYNEVLAYTTYIIISEKIENFEVYKCKMIIPLEINPYEIYSKYCIKKYGEKLLTEDDESKEESNLNEETIEILSNEFKNKYETLEKENLFLKEQNKQLNSSNDSLTKLIEKLMINNCKFEY